MWDDPNLQAWAERPTVETTVAATAVAVIDLDELRGHVRQPLEDDDALLQALELVAQDDAAALMGRPLLACTRRAWFDRIPGRIVRLSESASTIVDVRAYDKRNAETVVASSVYRADLVSEPARIALNDGEVWPTDLRLTQALAVTYTTGWTPATIPAAIRHALLMLVAHYYATPEPMAAERIAHVPTAVRSLLARYTLKAGVA